MKKHYVSMAMLAGISVVCCSCVAPAAGYATYSAPGGVISAGVSWTNASYDADGFPIFGYAYGRPVYGYTAAGAAVFSIAALTALCFVPHWAPASWYHGPHHYPHGIHRVAAPPRFPSGHRPGVRPPSGITPPPRPASPARPALPAPGKVNHAPAPGRVNPAPAPGRVNPAPGRVNPAPGRVNPAPAPGRVNHAQPSRGGAVHLPAPAGHKVAPVPSVRSNGGHPVSTMPARPAQKVASVPAVRSSSSHPVSTMPAPSGQRVNVAPRSGSSFGSSSSGSRPSFGMRPSSGGAAHGRGGHGRR